MADTQWPRYEVFKQDKPARPHEAIGTVHASDGEIALQNARDVYVRRPDCHSLWVAPESAILKITAQQLPNGQGHPAEGGHSRPSPQRFQVFAKKTLRRSMIAAAHVGEVHASSASHALAMALENPEWNKGEIYVWWIVPENALIRNDADDILSMFEPATRKTYKQQSRYGLVERTLEAPPPNVSDRQSPQ